jgi:CheY-like chemotaxis protein
MGRLSFGHRSLRAPIECRRPSGTRRIRDSYTAATGRGVRSDQCRGAGTASVQPSSQAQSHGCALKVDGKLGAGASIRLVPPNGAAASVSVMPIDAPHTPARSLRILVVDDDPSLTESLRCTLEEDGHHVVVADGGQAGIDAFDSARQALVPFDIVITDLGLPYVDGRQVAARVRAAAPDTPIIMLTGWGQHPSADKETTPQVDRLMSKPPRLQELRKALAELTSNRKNG